MPVATAILEGWRVVKGVQKIKAKLLKLPRFPASYVSDLPLMLDALKAKEKAWKKAHRGQLSNSTAKAHDEAVTLKGLMMAAGRYLEQDNPEALTELAEIAAGDGVADLIDDLDNLAAFAEDRKADFEAMPTLPKNAITWASELARILESGVDTDESIEAKAERNQVFVLVDKTVKAVRAAAELVLHDQPAKLAPMLSRYHANKVAKSRRNKKAGSGESTPAVTPATDGVKKCNRPTTGAWLS